MSTEEIKKLKDKYERYQGFWKLNKSLESQGVYGFIKTENKIKYIEFFKYYESKILNKKKMTKKKAQAVKCTAIRRLSSLNETQNL